MNLLDWLQTHRFFELFLVFSLMCAAVITLILMIKVGWNTITRTAFMQWCDLKDTETLQDRIKSMIEERLRIKEHECITVLMEKQRLRELEIEELKLQLRLRETEFKGEKPCSPM